MTRSFFTLRSLPMFVSAAVLVVASACSSSSSGTTDTESGAGTGGTTSAGGTSAAGGTGGAIRLPTGDTTRGATLVTTAHFHCAECHQEDDTSTGILAGRLHQVTGLSDSPHSFPNLTPDMDTGIGSWTDAQIQGALRNHTDDQSMQLCSVMPIFTADGSGDPPPPGGAMTDQDLADVIAYLRSIPSVKNDIPDPDCE